MKKLTLIFVLLLFLIGCKTKAQKQIMKEEKEFTNDDWKKKLTPIQFKILREAGTERPGTSEYNDFSEDGIYLCAGCDSPLYKSEDKFNAHCGWPSFDNSIEENIELDVDYKVGYARTELKCKKCGGHLGHVFDDGPTETGKRHCLNGAALKFVSKKE